MLLVAYIQLYRERKVVALACPSCCVPRVLAVHVLRRRRRLQGGGADPEAFPLKAEAALLIMIG